MQAKRINGPYVRRPEIKLFFEFLVHGKTNCPKAKQGKGAGFRDNWRARSRKGRTDYYEDKSTS